MNGLFDPGLSRGGDIVMADLLYYITIAIIIGIASILFILLLSLLLLLLLLSPMRALAANRS